jgi:DNA polymerase-4
VSFAEQTTETIALEIKRSIREETGLTCSIGAAQNKRLAKIASDLDKPDGLTIIGADDLERKIWPLPVRKVPGIGPKTEQRLQQLGIASIGDLAAVAHDDLIARFGESYGQFLYEAARGIDARPLVTQWEPKQRSRERTFQRDTSDWQTVAKMLAQLSRDVAQDLRDDGLCARTIGIKLRFADFETLTRDKTLKAATDVTESIRKAAFDCLARIELKRPVRLLGVRAGALEKRGGGP